MAKHTSDIELSSEVMVSLQVSLELLRALVKVLKEVCLVEGLASGLGGFGWGVEMGRYVGRVGEGLILVVVGGVGKGEEGTSFVEPLIGIGLEFCFDSAGKVQAEIVLVGRVQVETMRVGIVLAVMALAGMFGLLGNSLFAHPPPA